MSSPTFNIAITLEEIVSSLETWTEQITKVGSIEDMRRVEKASKSLTTLSKWMSFRITNCHDCMIVDINDFEEAVWKYDECAYYAAQHYEETEERGDY
eukprot:9557835-Ditylum_brightwellii.AAC.1